MTSLRACMAIALAWSAHCQAAQDWLTIVGDPEQAAVETIAIDPTPVLVKDNIRLMNIRVNRASTRVSGDGIAFRSFIGMIEVDCRKKSARYAQAQFFRDPLWASPIRMVTYSHTDVRPMAFRGFDPNPNERIIRAACAPRG